MRLILLYAAQVAFIIAGFAAVSSVFVSINSDAMSSTVTQLLSSTVTLATAQAVAPLDKFAVQVAAWADMLYANPALLCSDPTSAEWTPEDIRLAPSPSYVSPATFRVTQGKDIKLSLHRNNPLALYVYEAFQMPDNASQWVNCGTGRLSDVVFQFYAPSLHRGGVSGSPDVNSCEGHLSTNAYGRLQPQVVESDWACEIQTDVYPSIADYQLAVRALTYNDSKTGQWTGFSSFWDPTLNITSQLMTFAVPLTFSAPDPITGAYHCTNAASMDLNGQWLGDALHAEVIDGVELAMFWDRDESLVAWTLPAPSSDPSTGAVLQAGLTDSRFDAAVTAFDAAGWCSQSDKLSTCVSPSVKASVSNSRYVFAMRRIVHINARFTIVIAGDQSTFFGPGERARAVGIGVSVAVCAVCLATSVLLWLMTVRPLRRLIGNMELAATFSSDVDAEADSCISEVNEANVAFLSMHEELQMAKPFMPQHLLERLEEGRAPQHFDAAETSDMQSVPHSADDTRTVVSSSWRSRSSVNKRSTVRSAGVSVVSLESRFVAVLVINITGFDKIIRCTNVTEMEDLYAKFIDAVLHVAKAHRGVLDSAQGDHIMVSFNSGMKCAAPAAKAINAAFALRAMLSSLPPEWGRITCGIASGHAHCGALGSTEAMSHVTLGTVVRQAIGLQRVARVLDDERRESVADQGSSSVAPGWCVGTARVVQDCVTFAHFRYEAVAVLPPSSRATVIATLFPPVEIRTTQLSSIDASATEWLYAVGATSSANPHAAHNESVQSTYNSLTSVPAEVAAPLLEVARSSTVNRALSAVAVPQLAPL